MPAYLRRSVRELVHKSTSEIVGMLQQAYARDGFSRQYTRQTKAWGELVPLLQEALRSTLAVRSDAAMWTVLLEYPLYRLRRRIDIVILAGAVIVVIECKVGALEFTAVDKRQVEEYALDLRDFHAESHGRNLIPVLWSTLAPPSRTFAIPMMLDPSVAEVKLIGAGELESLCLSLPAAQPFDAINAETWDRAPYKPVPNVIEAATSIFAGHDVRAIANADAENLRLAAGRLLELVEEARCQRKRSLLFLTGVPGSGKTLAGLHVVHNAVSSGLEAKGDIVYLSGNTPLVVVLREALARDEYSRRKRTGAPASLGEIRREVRARIQHINDFLQQAFRHAPETPPHEHVIVFDEAQRAWDEKQGLEKFERTASEPALLLELMARHNDWCACVCLIGGGQEINSGEEGVFGWGEAIRRIPVLDRSRWTVHAPPDVLSGGPSAGSFTLGDLPEEVPVQVETELQLRVPQRSYRSPHLSRWVDAVLDGADATACEMARSLLAYPVVVTRCLETAKQWLKESARGERRYGLLASSGARRLRAEGLGVTLSASDGAEIAHWYLNSPGDIRASYALEVPANEYTCQGLELDFVCVCWGGDLLWHARRGQWEFASLTGTSWRRVHSANARKFIANSYRVLLTRAREGLVLWIPTGDSSDATRSPVELDATAAFLTSCGAALID